MRRRYRRTAILLVFVMALTAMSTEVWAVASPKTPKITEKKVEINIPAVEDFDGEQTTNTSVTLTWKETAGVSGYYLYMKADAAGKYKKIATLKASVTEYKKSKLTYGNKYHFYIKAYKKYKNKIYTGIKSNYRTIRLVCPTMRYRLTMPESVSKDGKTIKVVLYNYKNNDYIKVFGTTKDTVSAAIVKGNDTLGTRILLQMVTVRDLTTGTTYYPGENPIPIKDGRSAEITYAVDPSCREQLSFDPQKDKFMFFVKYIYNAFSIEWTQEGGYYDKKI